MVKKLSGGQAAVASLKRREVSHIFGLIGSATMELFDALYDEKDINFIGVRDERTGVHMADGYARASGKAGIIIAGQNGPGATNLTTGLSQAMAAFSPVISIAGALSLEHIYRDAFQEVDQQALFAPITKKTWTVLRTERIFEMFDEAFRVALTPRRGPVHLNLPRDILAQTHDFKTINNTENPPYAFPMATDDAIIAAAQRLYQAQRAVIIAGGGIKNSSGYTALLDLAELLNIPIVTSPGHGDAIPFGHPLNAGQMGPRGNMVASSLVKEADVILALGTRLGFNSTFYSYDNINQAADIIHVELEATAIGRYFPIAQGIWADAVITARQLTQEISGMKKKSEVNAWVDEYKARHQAYLKTRDETAKIDAHPIHPSGLFKILRDVLPRETAITMDAGTLCLQATDAINYFCPPALFTPLDFGLVGFSFACGLGVKVAMPHRPVVSLMGDGGFGMTVSELSTAVQYGINTVTLVMNNQCWGAEKAYQRDFFSGRYLGSDISSPPFDRIAQLYGAIGFRVDRIGDIADAVSSALSADKPAVVDIAVDPQALYSFRRDSFRHRS